MKINRKTFNHILDVLILLIPFIDFSTNIETDIFCIRLTYIIYFVYFLLNIKLLKVIFSKNIFFKIPKVYIYCICLIIISSLVNIFLHNGTLILFLKQLIIIPFTFVTILMFFYNHNNDIYYILDLYMKICLILSSIAIIQELSYLIGFKYGYDFFWLKYINQISTSRYMLRVTSICGEPSMFVYATIPVFFISLYSFVTKTTIFFRKDIYKLIIIISILLTYSLIGYCGAILSIFLILFWFYKKIYLNRFLVFLILFVLFYSLGKTSMFDRIIDSYALSFQNQNIQRKEQEHYNESSYVLYVACKISTENFKHNPIFGSGLGSYFITYQKYVNKFHKAKVRNLHQKDGCSLFLRIMAEMGFIGIFILFYFILSTYIKDFTFRNKFNYWVIVNNSIIVYICLRLIRNAVYYSDGIWIFICLYYFSKQKFLEERKKEVITQLS